jgi:hypothetical protein
LIGGIAAQHPAEPAPPAGASALRPGSLPPRGSGQDLLAQPAVNQVAHQLAGGCEQPGVAGRAAEKSRVLVVHDAD